MKLRNLLCLRLSTSLLLLLLLVHSAAAAPARCWFTLLLLLTGSGDFRGGAPAHFMCQLTHCFESAHQNDV